MDIRAVFSLSRVGVMAMRYAIDLAARLPDSRLIIMHRQGELPDRARAFMDDLNRPGLPISLQEFGDLNESTIPADDILVSHEPIRRLPRTHVLYPVEETAVRNGGMKICLPFGSGSTGAYAPRAAFALALSLKAEIVMVHTTWRNTEIASELAIDHMSQGASRVLKQLSAEADRLGLKVSTCCLAMALDVPRFIVETANSNGCQLIAMERRHNTLRGGYVDEVVRQTNIPVLAMRRERP